MIPDSGEPSYFGVDFSSDPQNKRSMVMTVRAPLGRTGEPHALTAAAITDAVNDGEQCLTCHDVPTGGQYAIDNRGPFQMILIRTYWCPSRHQWRHESDGG